MKPMSGRAPQRRAGGLREFVHRYAYHFGRVLKPAGLHWLVDLARNLIR